MGYVQVLGASGYLASYKTRLASYIIYPAADSAVCLVALFRDCMVVDYSVSKY